MRSVFDEAVSPGDMTAEDFAKLKYVDERLAPMLRDAFDGNVIVCEFVKSAMFRCEAVRLRVCLGAPDYQHVHEMHVDVTGLGIRALTKWVWQTLERAFPEEDRIPAERRRR